MNLIGTSELETERLILKIPTIKEQKRLWEILMIPEVNRYYLTVPLKYRENLLDWDKQKHFYEEKIAHSLDKNKFEWSIFLKENGECIGRISCHERQCEDKSITNPSIRGVGWYIDPDYQGKGYATEAAKAMCDYMFKKADISEIITGAAVNNPASWRIMEKLGMQRTEKTYFIQYTFSKEPIEVCTYIINKEDYLNYVNIKDANLPK